MRSRRKKGGGGEGGVRSELTGIIGGKKKAWGARPGGDLPRGIECPAAGKKRGRGGKEAEFEKGRRGRRG